MNPPRTALEPTPLAWIEASDLESIAFDKSTWIPLRANQKEFEIGKSGFAGHREYYRSIETLIVPLAQREEFKDRDWQSVARSGGTDGTWADEKMFYPPGCYDQDPRFLYPVIMRSFESGERDEWVLQHEIEIGLQLLRRGDVWVCPRENDVEVVRLLRRADDTPAELLIRAEHLRDYLCAKKAALLVTGFYLREAVEENFEGVAWEDGRQKKTFATGERSSSFRPIHEGGEAFGMEIAVMHAWRESVNPNHDVPEMPHPSQDEQTGMDTFTVKARGRNLHMLYTRVWTKHWIEPAAKSPRIRRDEVESKVNFIVDNQAQGTVAGRALKDYRGWLWFKPAVMRKLIGGPKGILKWYTQQTGRIGPSPNLALHFGVNAKGLINVLSHDMADLPEWAQKIWAGDNTVPEGELSDELHASQNLARPAGTIAPEEALWRNMDLLQAETKRIYGKPLFFALPGEREFHTKVHRFYCDSFEEFCELCKELHRVVSEQIDIGALNDKIDPKNAEEANKAKLRQIKRVDLWMTKAGHEGRKITQALVGVADLRQGDAHAQGSKLRESLPLLGIPKDTEDYQRMGLVAIAEVGKALAVIGKAISPDVKLAFTD